mmetsp:Transcript_18975/g.28204  ORF Transcript_18975/g.28204 Transcript_18975/m.28204 type:complete len:159 (+) Transcript_18975:450-926(+)
MIILGVQGEAQMEIFQSWNHSKILTYAAYWGIFYVCLDVLVTKFTLVFLSWLIEETKDMNLITVTGIIIIVGLTLFLLPPIPGVPIYLTSGIVLTSVVGRDSLGSITAAIAYPCAVSLGLKLLACTLQQKAIGEPMRNLCSTAGSNKFRWYPSNEVYS